MDFYPDGGSVQSGCVLGSQARPGGTCSHGRSVLYFAHSIREPQLFPAQPCASVEACNKETVSSDQTVAYMGEQAASYWDGKSRSLYYSKVPNCYWTMSTHSNWLCLG